MPLLPLPMILSLRCGQVASGGTTPTAQDGAAAAGGAFLMAKLLGATDVTVPTGELATFLLLLRLILLLLLLLLL